MVMAVLLYFRIFFKYICFYFCRKLLLYDMTFLKQKVDRIIECVQEYMSVCGFCVCVCVCNIDVIAPFVSTYILKGSNSLFAGLSVMVIIAISSHINVLLDTECTLTKILIIQLFVGYAPRPFFLGTVYKEQTANYFYPILHLFQF